MSVLGVKLWNGLSNELKLSSSLFKNNLKGKESMIIWWLCDKYWFKDDWKSWKKKKSMYVYVYVCTYMYVYVHVCVYIYVYMFHRARLPFNVFW